MDGAKTVTAAVKLFAPAVVTVSLADAKTGTVEIMTCTRAFCWRQRWESEDLGKSHMNLIRTINCLILHTRTVVMAMVIASSISSCFAAPLLPSSSAPSAQIPRLLTVIEGRGRPGNAVYESGVVGPQIAGPLEHMFVLRNDTPTSLTLDHLQSSCPCTTASLVGTSDGATISPVRQILFGRAAPASSEIAPL